MQYSLINNQRVKPEPKLKGICPICGAPTISKCGNRKIWHWAHEAKKHCDPWWENETEWHRNWKAEFPEDSQEIVHFDDTGEKHQADVKTNTGIIIEFQNSPMSIEELKSRELFYKNMVWVVNGENFKKNFHILEHLPDPESGFAQDLVFKSAKYNQLGRVFWKKSENPEFGVKTSMVRIHSMHSIKKEIQNNYTGHHLYDWIKPRTIWLEAQCPVYIDFGGDVLWRLEKHNHNLNCIRAISKRKFIHDVNTENNVYRIASKFYPINS